MTDWVIDPGEYADLNPRRHTPNKVKMNEETNRSVGDFLYESMKWPIFSSFVLLGFSLPPPPRRPPGIITEMTWKVHKIPAVANAVRVSFGSIDAAAKAVQDVLAVRVLHSEWPAVAGGHIWYSSS